MSIPERLVVSGLMGGVSSKMACGPRLKLWDMMSPGEWDVAWTEHVPAASKGSKCALMQIFVSQTPCWRWAKINTCYPTDTLKRSATKIRISKILGYYQYLMINDGQVLKSPFTLDNRPG